MAQAPNKPAFKYRIKELIVTNHGNEQQTEIRRKIRANCGHSADNWKTLSLWESIPYDSETSIPGDALQIIASILNVRMDELYNKKPVIISAEIVKTVRG